MPMQDSIVHSLTASNAASAELWLGLRELSATIFGTQLEDGSRFASDAEWRSRLDEQEGVLLYCLQEDGTPCAFLFAHRKAFQPPISAGSITASTTTHIWLSGVLPAFRQRGLMSKLFDNLLSRRAKSALSVRTHSERFPQMVSWLSKTGWVKAGEDADGILTFLRAPG